MNIADLALNIVVIFATSVFLYRGWYPAAVATFMVFVLLQVNIVLVWITRPLPRWIYSVQIPTQDQEAPEEVPVEEEK